MNTDAPRNRPDDEQSQYPADLAFVVQFSQRTAAPGLPASGRVEHLSSGRALRFSNSEDLLRFMARVLTERSDQRAAGDDGNA